MIRLVEVALAVVLNAVVYGLWGAFVMLASLLIFGPFN
jgi:hypothetical protein